MENALPATICQDDNNDLIEMSRERYFLVVVFFNSKSQFYDDAVRFAKKSSAYGEFVNGKTTTHVAAFSREKDQAIIALKLCRLLSGLRNVSYYIKGKPAGNNFMNVLGCYVDSHECSDYRAYCCLVVPDQSYNVIASTNLNGRYIFPCEMLSRNMHRKLNADHPANLKEQIVAEAARNGISFCPNFNPDLFRKI